MIMGHLSKHNYSFMACSHCICDGQRTSCQHTSSYLSRLNEGGGYNDRENDPCVSWKPACHIWNMKVIYSKGQYCNGRRAQLASLVRLSGERFISVLCSFQKSHICLFFLYTAIFILCFHVFVYHLNNYLNKTVSRVSIHPLTYVQYMI